MNYCIFNVICKRRTILLEFQAPHEKAHLFQHIILPLFFFFFFFSFYFLMMQLLLLLISFLIAYSNPILALDSTNPPLEESDPTLWGSSSSALEPLTFDSSELFPSNSDLAAKTYPSTDLFSLDSDPTNIDSSSDLQFPSLDPILSDDDTNTIWDDNNSLLADSTLQTPCTSQADPPLTLEARDGTSCQSPSPEPDFSSLQQFSTDPLQFLENNLPFLPKTGQVPNRDQASKESQRRARNKAAQLEREKKALEEQVQLGTAGEDPCVGIGNVVGYFSNNLCCNGPADFDQYLGTAMVVFELVENCDRSMLLILYSLSFPFLSFSKPY